MKGGNILFLLVVGSDITNLKKRGDIQHFYMTNGKEKFLYQLNIKKNQVQAMKLLTNRELEITKLIGQDFTSEQIGDKLFISSHTVNTHRKNILAKTGMGDTVELINFLQIYRLFD